MIWTPSSLTFTIDGAVWGEITNRAEVPRLAMTLDIDQEARCIAASWASCPVRKVSLLVDWVAEYRKK